jgi:hypothetical protein
MSGGKPKELTVQDLIKQELMAQLLTPKAPSLPLDILPGINLYG